MKYCRKIDKTFMHLGCGNFFDRMWSTETLKDFVYALRSGRGKGINPLDSKVEGPEFDPRLSLRHCGNPLSEGFYNLHNISVGGRVDKVSVFGSKGPRFESQWTQNIFRIKNVSYIRRPMLCP